MGVGNSFWKKREPRCQERGKEGFGNSLVPTALCVRHRYSGKGGKRLVRCGEETGLFCYIIQKYPAFNANFIIDPGNWVSGGGHSWSLQ